MLKGLGLIIIMLWSSVGFACKCSNEKSIKRSYKMANLVVSGTVKDILYLVKPKKSNSLASEIYPLDTIRVNDFQQYQELLDTLIFVKKIVEIHPLKQYKGTETTNIRIKTGSGTGDCGYPFEIGQNYLIYATSEQSTSTEEPFFYTDRCTRTSILEESVDVPFLEKFNRSANQ